MQPPRNVPSSARIAMHAAAAETGDFAHRIEALDRLAIGAQHAAVEIGLQAAQRLAGQDVEPDRDQRAILRIEQLVRLCRADQPVAEIGAGAAQGGDLHVLGERIVELPVAGSDLALDLGAARAMARRRPARSCGRPAPAVRPRR